jgi:hypothetical protein
LRETLAVSRIAAGHLFPMHVRLGVVAASVVPMLACIGAGYQIGLAASPPNAPVFILGGVIAGALLAQPITKAANRWSVRRLNGVLSGDGEITISVDDNGVHYKSAFATSQTLWTGIDRVIDSHGSVLLVTGVSVHFIPARCFASDGERRSVLEFARERVSEKARRQQ